MYPLQQESNEVVIQFCSNNVDQQPHKDLILHHCDSSLLHKKLVIPPRKKIFSGNNKNDSRSNKVAHRDIERQRRKQMATLHASLRSLLPLQFIKGKRSISDQIKEAVNYIKQLQNNLKELTAKRDKLKKLSSSSIITTNSLAPENPHYKNHVAAASSTSFSVQLNDIGTDDEGMIEITCCCNYSYSRDQREEQVVPLSKLLKLVLQEGLHVVTSLSTQLNNATLIHTLHCQVKSNNSVDLSELRSKLVNEISSSFRCYL
ncbi:hypothetical protein PIB30_039461 [Stylosanthes scabra]|uniref:BHLH domain-containing protein n=1 Tax=Stylosanthes scabra TaxID=79078 RepID=A0ABU6VDM2_9FABA|nr:hypothetical protein [Stylosanthes scabra]